MQPHVEGVRLAECLVNVPGPGSFSVNQQPCPAGSNLLLSRSAKDHQVLVTWWFESHKTVVVSLWWPFVFPFSARHTTQAPQAPSPSDCRLSSHLLKAPLSEPFVLAHAAHSHRD
jgi:hypothetical protein